MPRRPSESASVPSAALLRRRGTPSAPLATATYGASGSGEHLRKCRTISSMLSREGCCDWMMPSCMHATSGASRCVSLRIWICVPPGRKQRQGSPIFITHPVCGQPGNGGAQAEEHGLGNAQTQPNALILPSSTAGTLLCEAMMYSSIAMPCQAPMMPARDSSAITHGRTLLSRVYSENQELPDLVEGSMCRSTPDLSSRTCSAARRQLSSPPACGHVEPTRS